MATVLVHGQIRAINHRRSKKNDTPYTEVGIVPEFGSALGLDPLRVYVFPREGEEAPLIGVGLVVNWVVDVTARNGFLNATFRHVATEHDFERALRDVVDASTGELVG